MTERVVYCPECRGRYDVPRTLLSDDKLVLLCGACGHAARVAAFEDEGASVAAVEDPFVAAQRPRVVVGHELPAATRPIAHALRRAGFEPVLVARGEDVLAACDPALPDVPAAVLLDVGVPGVLSFEVVEQLRAHPASKAMPVILLASVFERTRYKRRPTTLYGADAYLELHHVPDRLGSMLTALLDNRAPPDERIQSPVERARAAALRTKPDPNDPEALRSFARRLLSDVVLYHGDEVADGVRRGAPFSSLPSALGAARELFAATSARGDVFEEEVSALSRRLLERDAIRQAAQGRAHA